MPLGRRPASALALAPRPAHAFPLAAADRPAEEGEDHIHHPPVPHSICHEVGRKAVVCDVSSQEGGGEAGWVGVVGHKAAWAIIQLRKSPLLLEDLLRQL